jgi:hypothetical protein
VANTKAGDVAMTIVGASRLSVIAVPLLASAVQAATVYRNTAPEVGYVGSKVCAGCHSAIYNTFVKTAMGRSMSVPDSKLADPPANIQGGALNRDYRVFREKDAAYQAVSQTDGSQLVFEDKQKLEYVIGSGENGMTFAIRRGHYLFQAPLSYYSRPGKWALSPGYDQLDLGFARPIYDACITCHAGRPQAMPGRDGLYRDPPFKEMAIGCENCHGPGQLHADERGRGLKPTSPDDSIVNLAKLTPRLAEDVCMKCHQTGDARVLLPGKTYDDFRPGKPLVETLAIVNLPLSQAGTDLLEHHVSMKLSKCFRASRGNLSCLSCHDPHQQPDAAAAPSFYRARCLACHGSNQKPCRFSPTIRAAQNPPDNCVACHMPKRDIHVISHSALTNHRVPLRPDDIPPRDLPDSLTTSLPGLLLLDATPGEHELPLSTRLQAYGELSAKVPELLAPYQSLLNEASTKLPDDPVVLSALGRRSFLKGEAEAIGLMQRAVDTGTPGATTFLDLGEALDRAGLLDESAAALARGVAIYQYSMDLRKRLILAYIRQKKYTDARNSLEAYVQDFPQDSFMRALLEKATGAPR